MQTFMKDDRKFKELILYVSQRCANQPTWGSVKLNKILYYSDFLAYAKTGAPITGHEYQKLTNGPAPRQFPIIRDQMLKDRSLGIQPVQLKSGHVQKRPINLREPRLDLFSGDEIATVDFVIDALKDADAETTSWFSHQMIGWIVAKDGETIPYASVFVSHAALTESEIRRGEEIASKYLSGARRVSV